MDRDYILKKLKSYDPSFDEKKINKAIDFSINYHGDQKRESGELYYYHPFEVAKIVLDMRLDSDSVITALLHDTVEDTELTLEEIGKHFGKNVASLIDGVTKLSKIKFVHEQAKQAENFRKLFLAVSEDIRVLLVKLADRLHNMRTLHYVKSEEKKKRIALETMEIYAPLAERMGIQQIKSELQDIAFEILYPEARSAVIKKLNEISDGEERLVEEVSLELKKRLAKEGIKAWVHGRRKTPYSIWLKLQHKNVGLEQLSDLIAFRIIVKEVSECYRALGIIHTQYKMVPESFQDFISTPKENGYRSLHTVIIGPQNHKAEVQIRTEEMHEVAEYGIAAHWRYKQNYKDVTDGSKYKWINELLDILKHETDPEEFLRNTKLSMYYDQVFCFTPKGVLISLPKKATVIDFAYAVHSSVGNHCVGAKVNGKSVPLKTILKNGDQVEIITSASRVPSLSWRKFVVTGKAHSEIKRFIKNRQKEDYINLGKSVVENAFQIAGAKDFDAAAKKTLDFFGFKSQEELFFSVADGTLGREEISHSLLSSKGKIASAWSKIGGGWGGSKSPKPAMAIKGLISGMAINFGECCSPMPGESIIGVITKGAGVTVHTAECKIPEISGVEAGRLIELAWDSDRTKVPHIFRVRITIPNEIGNFAAITSDIASLGGNIINLRITYRSVDFFEVEIDAESQDSAAENRIISSLKADLKITKVQRIAKK